MFQDFGARMEGIRYLPGNLYRVDHVGGVNGSLWQLINNGGTCNGARVYSVSPEVSSLTLNQYQAYNKELVRQTMLKQDAVFRAQVREMHRLYMRQRELMDEIKAREQYVDHLRKQSLQPCYSLSQMLPDVSQNPVQVPAWLLVKPRGSMPSALGPGNFKKVSDSSLERDLYHSSLERDLYRDSTICPQNNGLREDRASSSKRRNCEKPMFDLELQAEAYIHGEEEVPHFSLEPCKRAERPPNPSHNLNNESSYNANSSCLKPAFLLDLNEAPQLGESENAKCCSYVESHGSITGLTQKDLCGNFKSISPLPVEDIYYGHPLSHNNGSFPCSGLTTSCPFPDERKSEASAADQKTLLHNVVETSAVIQALPCFNTLKCLNESCRCCTTKFELKRKKPEGPSSSMGIATAGINVNGNCESITEPLSRKRCIKEPNTAKSSKGMDLNVTPSACLAEIAVSGEYVSSIEGQNMFEDRTGKLSSLKGEQLTGCPYIPGTSDSSQLSALTSNTVLVKSSEDEGVLDCRKLGVTWSSYSSDQSEMCSKKDSDIVPATEEELAFVQAAQTEVGSNLVRSVSPDDKEHNVKGIPCQSSEKKIGYPDDDIERISAETIVSISQSGSQAILKTSRTIIPVGTSSDCLDWFADIICSAESDPEIEFEKSTLANVDDKFSAIKHRKNKRTAAGSMLVKQRKARAKKARQIKEFKSEEVQHVDSLSSCNMNENPQPSNVTCGRNFDSKNHVKRRCRSSSSTMTSSNRRLWNKYSGADHFTDGKGLYCLLSYLCQWGKKNRRQKGRRARADNLPWCWQNLVPC